MEDFTVTTVYYDGQFWSALIEKQIESVYYTGRYVFGAEPTNPRILFWMIYEFDKIPLFKTENPIRIRIKKITNRSEKSFTKSLDIFKNAQADFLSKKKTECRERKREDKRLQWELKKDKRKKKN